MHFVVCKIRYIHRLDTYVVTVYLNLKLTQPMDPIFLEVKHHIHAGNEGVWMTQNFPYGHISRSCRQGKQLHEFFGYIFPEKNCVAPIQKYDPDGDGNDPFFD